MSKLYFTNVYVEIENLREKNKKNQTENLELKNPNKILSQHPHTSLKNDFTSNKYKSFDEKTPNDPNFLNFIKIFEFVCLSLLYDPQI